MNINDFKMLLDTREYQNLEGRWRDLITRIKWDTVKSVVKSVAGLNKSKFRVRAWTCCCARPVIGLPHRRPWAINMAGAATTSGLHTRSQHRG